MRLRILRYLATLAAIRFGCQHSLTVILFHLLNTDVLTQSTSSALKMLILKMNKEPALLERSIGALDHAQCHMLIDRGEYCLALEPASRLLEGASRSGGLGLKSVLTRCALLRQGEICFGLGNLVEAKHYYQRSIDMAEGRWENSFPDPVGVEAVGRLASLQVHCGDYTAAEGLCRAALDNTWTPLSEPDATGSRSALTATLKRQCRIRGFKIMVAACRILPLNE